MTRLGDQLLSTRQGAAFLACGAAVGRMRRAIADPGLTLCLAGHALGEVRRGTDGGRIAHFVRSPGAWLREAADVVEEASPTWWSHDPRGAVVRVVDDHTAGPEVVDARGRRRSAVEEAAPHVHHYATRDGRGTVTRGRLDAQVPLLVVDGPEDVTDTVRDAVGDRDAPALHLTLRGALTVPRDLVPGWPWPVAGTHWPGGLPAGAVHTTPGSPGPRVRHDHEWAPLGRPYDPRFDEGDEVDGSELDDAPAHRG